MCYGAPAADTGLWHATAKAALYKKAANLLLLWPGVVKVVEQGYLVAAAIA